MLDANAMRDLLKNYKSNFSTLNSEKKKTSKMQFKSKKRDESETIVVHHKQALEEEGRNNNTSNFFWEGTAAYEEGSHYRRHSLGYDDSRIQRTKLNHYYFTSAFQCQWRFTHQQDG